MVARGAVMQQLPMGGAMSAGRPVPDEQVANLVAEEPTCGIAAIQWLGFDGGVRTRRCRQAHHHGTGPRRRRGSRRCPSHMRSTRRSWRLHRRRCRAFADTVTPRKATIPLISTVHGTVIDGTDMDADYWAAQLTSTVRFVDAMRTAATQASPTHLVELGPRTTLLAHAQQLRHRHAGGTLAPCGGPNDDGAGFARGRRPAVRRWARHPLRPASTNQSRTLKRLPPYVFGDGSRFSRALDTAVVTRVGIHSDERSAPLTPAPRRTQADGLAPLASRIRRLVADIGGYAVEQIDPDAATSEPTWAATPYCNCYRLHRFGPHRVSGGCRRHLSAKC